MRLSSASILLALAACSGGAPSQPESRTVTVLNHLEQGYSARFDGGLSGDGPGGTSADASTSTFSLSTGAATVSIVLKGISDGSGGRIADDLSYIDLHLDPGNSTIRLTNVVGAITYFHPTLVHYSLPGYLLLVDRYGTDTLSFGYASRCLWVHVGEATDSKVLGYYAELGAPLTVHAGGSCDTARQVDSFSPAAIASARMRDGALTLEF